eukprot:CAMPEP_0205801422 /NCGR_PEP_ID=MMETSP0205-20121125/3406_1 /ASSEMBLY_ACC=CAM_ASM_000278 /TAXON_ID=36767 /ORGANISM="Euplotes focardii, Strain TN1" /LENGTH=97 /DNA_ID=CAMNT_0053066145 /DNA_START=599 /DNA_END=892 /DNA_ORIENTATION=-
MPHFKFERANSKADELSSSQAEVSQKLAPVMRVQPLKSDSSASSRREDSKAERREHPPGIFGNFKSNNKLDKKYIKQVLSKFKTKTKRRRNIRDSHK